jgi:hypothetical protein
LAKKQKTHDWLAIVGLKNRFLALKNSLHVAGEPGCAPHCNDPAGAMRMRISLNCQHVIHF